VQIKVSHAGKKQSVTARTTAVAGRAVTLQTQSQVSVSPLSTVTVKTIGKENHTNSENQLQELLVHVLQGRSSWDTSNMMSAVWFPPSDALEVRSIKPPAPISTTLPKFPRKIRGVTTTLNKSQDEAVKAMLGDRQLVLIHGYVALSALQTKQFLNSKSITSVERPPGTGKTTVISSFVEALTESSNECVYLVAHSNVAVKVSHIQSLPPMHPEYCALT